MYRIVYHFLCSYFGDHAEARKGEKELKCSCGEKAQWVKELYDEADDVTTWMMGG